MTKAFSEAIARRPPRGANAAQVDGGAQTLAVTSASSASTTLNQVANGSGYWVTMVCTQDCHIRFGVTGSVGNATTSDYLMRAGVAEEWWVESNLDQAFTVIRDTSDGTLYWYRSSR